MVDIIILMDMSSSVGNLLEYYINGLNNIIKTQQKLNPKCRLSLVTFNHFSTVHFEHQQITSLGELNPVHFKPNGATALYDSLMRVLVSEQENKNSIICITMTDGVDNVSHLNHGHLNNFIQTLKTQNWSFVFLGSSMDANQCGYRMGIDTCILYDESPSSITRASDSVNVAIAKVCSSLSGQENFLSKQDIDLDVRDLVNKMCDMDIDDEFLEKDYTEMKIQN